MIRSSIAIAIGALWLIGSPVAMPASMMAFADATPPDTAAGRYMFAQQPDGQGSSYLRLDTRTGEVALCSQRAVGFACEAAPEDRAVLENEIARLRAENAALKKDILSRGLPLPSGVSPEPPPAQSQNGGLGRHLPSNAEIDRMVAFAGHVWHRFMEAVERAQKNISNKS